MLGQMWTVARVRGVALGEVTALIDAVHASARVSVVAVDAAIEREAWDWLRRHDERVRLG